MRARSPGRLRLVVATALPAVCFGLLAAGVSIGSASAPDSGAQPAVVAFEPLSGSPIDPENTPTPTPAATPAHTATPRPTATATPHPTATPSPTTKPTATPVRTEPPTPGPTQPTPASTPSAQPQAASSPAAGSAPGPGGGGGGGGTHAGGSAPGAQASVATPPATTSPIAELPPPPPVSTQPSGPVSLLGGLAVVPGALEAFGKDPRTNRLNLDVIAAESLVAVSIGLCILLTELRRRNLV